MKWALNKFYRELEKHKNIENLILCQIPRGQFLTLVFQIIYIYHKTGRYGNYIAKRNSIDDFIFYTYDIANLSEISFDVYGTITRVYVYHNYGKVFIVNVRNEMGLLA